MTAATIPVPSGGVLIASANAQVRQRALREFESRRAPVCMASGGAEAFAKLDHGNWQMLVLDRQLPDLNADELVELTKRLHPEIEILVVDPPGHETNDLGRENPDPWCKGNRFSPVTFSPLPAVANVFEEAAKPDQQLPGMIGDSQPMGRVYRMVRLVAGLNTTVLITGPSGSGKELVAHAIHSLSARARAGFSVLNCAAIPETLIESELFGYARGAFTGAAQTYAGRILAAQGGTLFLDEVGELPLNAQSKLLRFLEQKEIQRLGSAETCKVDVRVVAATNRNLAELVERGKFRDDLFFRLCAFPIEIPPLSERLTDIAKLATYFLGRLTGQSALRVSSNAMQMLEDYSWPGNVRELQQVLERAAILAEDARVIAPEHLVFSFRRTRERAERVAC